MFNHYITQAHYIMHVIVPGTKTTLKSTTPSPRDRVCGAPALCVDEYFIQTCAQEIQLPIPEV